MDTIYSLELPPGTQAKYVALADALRQAVTAGRLPPGTRLPPVRELAHRLGVTPGTVARAYQRLTDGGVLEAQVGRGTFVSERSTLPRRSPAGSGAPVDLRRPVLADVGQAALIRRALRHAAEAPAAELLDYPDRAAGLPLREALTRDLDGTDLGAFSADDVVLGHGAQHAYLLTLQTVLRGPAPAVAIEALAYPGFRHGARLARAEVVAVDSDGEGPIPASLAAACDRADVQVFATSSNAQNPTTVRTSPARRREIAALARARDIQIVEDECYGRTPPGVPSYRALVPERVWYIGSLSKTFSSALRIGYVVAAEGRSEAARNTMRHNSFGISFPIAVATAEIVGAPEFGRIRAAVDATTSERVRILAEALSGFALDWAEDVPFAFLRLPSGWRASGFVRAAEARGVLVRPADDFVLVDGASPNAVRIAVNARVPLDDYRRAVAILRELLAAPPHDIEV